MTSTDEAKKSVRARIPHPAGHPITVAGERLTKNLYRREWRTAACIRHDDPIEVDPTDGIGSGSIVALVQKKVAELLGHEKFNNSFQIGMLASFESFLETSRCQARRTTTRSLQLRRCRPDRQPGGAPGYRRRRRSTASPRLPEAFGSEMPHPKMDALVAELAAGPARGRKALVFVRRVASVKELQAKLEERYDQWLFGPPAGDLPGLSGSLERAFELYREEQWALGRRGAAAAFPPTPASWRRVRRRPAAASGPRHRRPGHLLRLVLPGRRPQGVLRGQPRRTPGQRRGRPAALHPAHLGLLYLLRGQLRGPAPGSPAGGPRRTGPARRAPGARRGPGPRGVASRRPHRAGGGPAADGGRRRSAGFTSSWRSRGRPGAPRRGRPLADQAPVVRQLLDAGPGTGQAGHPLAGGRGGAPRGARRSSPSFGRGTASATGSGPRRRRPGGRSRTPGARAAAAPPLGRRPPGPRLHRSVRPGPRPVAAQRQGTAEDDEAAGGAGLIGPFLDLLERQMEEADPRPDRR